MDKTISTPKISVVLPVYNCERYIKQSVVSILRQTFSDFELIIINDGSTDSTPNVLSKINDERVRIISRENKGLVASLNEGVSMARGNLIARQDADDISEPTRLEEQARVLDNDSTLVAIGTSIRTINMSGKLKNTHHVLTGKNAVKSELLIRSPFAHGSVMFRREAFVLSGGYSNTDWPAEDYGLWLRMALHGSLDNISLPLYKYRENSSGISALNHDVQITRSNTVNNEAWKSAHSLIASFKPYDMQRFDEANNRAFSNAMSILRLALRKRHVITSLKILSVFVVSPMLVRKIAGKIRRSI